MTVRINIGALSLAEVADLREQLRTRPGQRRPETRKVLDESDDLIRQFAARYYPSFTRNQQTKAACAELHRYAGGTWLRTRADLECRHRDDRRQLIWKILKLRGGRAPRERTVNGILAGCLRTSDTSR